jgi:hypothetical protein
MDALWNDIKTQQKAIFLKTSKLMDTPKILGDDYSYVARLNGIKNNVVDKLSKFQRLHHPKFIHAKGIVGKFVYIPIFTQESTYMDLSGLCKCENLQGIFRFGPATPGKNLYGPAFKFFQGSEEKSIYNMLMLGGTASPYGKIGDIACYSTDTSFLLKEKDTDLTFLAHVFGDLVKNPNILSIEKFVGSKCKEIKFEFNSGLQRQFDRVVNRGDKWLLPLLCGIINSELENNRGQTYILGSFYIEHSGFPNWKGEIYKTKVVIGRIQLVEPVVTSKFANQYLFFQHELIGIKLSNPVNGCPGYMSSDLNENENHFTCGRLVNRIGYLCLAKIHPIACFIGLFGLFCMVLVLKN